MAAPADESCHGVRDPYREARHRIGVAPPRPTGLELISITVCRMFNQVISGSALPSRLSTANDLIERVIGTIRREYLDHTPVWNPIDVARMLEDFRKY